MTTFGVCLVINMAAFYKEYSSGEIKSSVKLSKFKWRKIIPNESKLIHLELLSILSFFFISGKT